METILAAFVICHRELSKIAESGHLMLTYLCEKIFGEVL